MKKIVSVIGSKSAQKGTFEYQVAFETGKLLVENGYRVLSGGLSGTMTAVFEGAHAAKNYEDGATIAIVPSFDPEHANPFADIIIPTGLDVLRNGLVANSDAVIAIGGGAGTLSEMAFAWTLYRLIVAFENIDGWAKKLAGTRIDEGVRCEGEDKIYGVTTPEEAVKVVNENIARYTKRHVAISPDGKFN